MLPGDIVDIQAHIILGDTGDEQGDVGDHGDAYAAQLCRYGVGLCHSLYSSQEVGQRAADSIVATFNSPFLADSALPRLRRGRLFATAVPGGGVFAYVCAAGMQPPNSLAAQVSK